MDTNELDILYCLFNYYEIRSQLENGKIFTNVIDEINRKLNTSFRHSYCLSRVEPYEQNIVAGLFAIDSLVFDKDYQEYIFSILDENHYYMKKFIKDLIKFLGNAKNQEEREKTIDRYQKLWLINNIKYNGVDGYTIESSYGDFSFTLADRVLTDEDIVSYIKNGDHRKTCEENAATLLSSYDDAYTICSLARNYFTDRYYHFYSYLKHKDAVLDICSNMLMKKETFDDLYDTKEILFMRNDELRKIYFEKIKDIKSNFKDGSLLKCALYFQSLKLEDNPEEKKRVLDYNNTILQGLK